MENVKQMTFGETRANCDQKFVYTIPHKIFKVKEWNTVKLDNT